MNTTYIEKLESHFHPAFVSTPTNQDLKKYETVSYVRMLEEMCRDRRIEIKREFFPITNNFIYIKDQFGNEHCWRIYEETNYGTYKVSYYNVITEIYINKTYRDLDNRLCYLESVYVPEDINIFSLSYIEELFERIAEEIKNKEKDETEQTQKDVEMEVSTL
jgi:hypothetical protein